MKDNKISKFDFAKMMPGKYYLVNVLLSSCHLKEPFMGFAHSLFK